MRSRKPGWRLSSAVTIVIAAAIAVPAAIACTTPNANNTEHQAANSGVNLLLQNQPVPIFATSELRQNMIEVEAIQALGAPTTTFFFPEGTTVVNVSGKPAYSAPPFKVCPSQGEPIHATDSLTNPLQVTSGGEVVGQMDPNGTYQGPNNGTYVLCLTASGNKKMSYWEGPVETESGVSVWNQDGGPGNQIQDIGPSQLPVCAKHVAQDGDGSGVQAGTEYYHCELAK